MSINHAVDLNLSASIMPPVLNMAQYDANSRTIIATLWDGTSGFTIPTGSYIMVRFGKPDGTGGLYDETEAGEAITFSGNVVTAPVATQMLSVAGKVQADIEIYQSGATEQAAVKLATFCFMVNVEKAAYPDAEIISSDYFNIIAGDISEFRTAQDQIIAAQAALEEVAESINSNIDAAQQAAQTATENATNAATSAQNAAASATSANAANTAAQTAKEDAESAKSAAETAATSAQNSKTAAESANTATQAAKQAAETAKADAEAAATEAQTSKIAAESAKTAAQTAKQAAETAEANAEAAATEAESSKTAAESAKTAAQTAKQAAETAENNAAASATSAQTSKIAAESANATAQAAKEDAESAKSAAETAATEAQNAASAMQECAPYSSTKSYVVGNMVTSGGSTYRCISPCTGIAPPDSTYWLLIAQKGADGSGSGDMSKATYDPNNKAQDVFSYADTKAGTVQTNLNTHAGNTNIHVTAEEKTAWNGKANPEDIPTQLSELTGDATHRLVSDTEKSTWNGKANPGDIPTQLSELTEDATHRLVTDTEKTAWNNKADSDDIPTQLSELTGDATHRLVSDTEKSTWNDKADKSTALTVTLSASAWADNSITVSATGVTANSIIIVAPAPDSHIAYCEAMARCTAQGAGTLTFAAEEVPTDDLTVNVLIV